MNIVLTAHATLSKAQTILDHLGVLVSIIFHSALYSSGSLEQMLDMLLATNCLFLFKL